MGDFIDDSKSKGAQDHPLYSIDRDHLDRLLGKDFPDNADIVDLARLFIRYKGYPGVLDLQEDIKKIMQLWDLSDQILNERAKKVWQEGYRPGRDLQDGLGSSLDTSAE